MGQELGGIPILVVTDCQPLSPQDKTHMDHFSTPFPHHSPHPAILLSSRIRKGNPLKCSVLKVPAGQPVLGCGHTPTSQPNAVLLPQGPFHYVTKEASRDVVWTLAKGYLMQPQGLVKLLKTWRLSHQKNKQTFQNFPANSEAWDPCRVTHGAHVKAPVSLSESRHSTDLHEKSLNTVLRQWQLQQANATSYHITTNGALRSSGSFG